MEPNTPIQQSPSPASTTSATGPIIGAVIVIALIALAGAYVWMQGIGGTTKEVPYIPSDTSADGSWMPPSNNSDEATAIEAELNATNMDAFDSQMKADINASAESL